MFFQCWPCAKSLRIAVLSDYGRFIKNESPIAHQTTLRIAELASWDNALKLSLHGGEIISGKLLIE